MSRKIFTFALSLLPLLFQVPAHLFSQTTATLSTPRLASQETHTAVSGHRADESLLRPSVYHFIAGTKRIFTTRSNLFYFLPATTASLVVRPYDDDISDDFSEDDLSELEVKIPNTLGSFFVVSGASLATHLIGRAAGDAYLANTGLYLVESFFEVQFITFLLKQSVNRTRPDSSNNLSFPSGHSSAMFNAAAVLHKRYSFRVALPLYALATYVGVTRVKSQKHFTTDVIAGAGLGLIVGRSFVPSKNERERFGILPSFGQDFIGVSSYIRF